jgi:hypothetical protein
MSTSQMTICPLSLPAAARRPSGAKAMFSSRPTSQVNVVFSAHEWAS